MRARGSGAFSITFSRFPEEDLKATTAFECSSSKQGENEAENENGPVSLGYASDIVPDCP
jgi:hypothetical protein